MTWFHFLSSVYSERFVLCPQGRNEIRWRPGQEARLAPPCSNLSSFESKCTVLKKILVTLLGLFGAPIVIRRPGNCAPLAPLRYAPVCAKLLLSYF